MYDTPSADSPVPKLFSFRSRLVVAKHVPSQAHKLYILLRTFFCGCFLLFRIGMANKDLLMQMWHVLVSAVAHALFPLGNDGLPIPLFR